MKLLERANRQREMVTLRATKKLSKLLPRSSGEAAISDTALGDWYVNRVVVSRRPLLLLTSAKSLLVALTPARDVKTLPKRLPDIVGDRLRRLGVDSHLIDSELDAMREVQLGPTQDRSVMGTMVEFAKSLPYHLPHGGRSENDLWAVEDEFERMPCRCSRSSREVVWPGRTTLRLLKERWQ